MRQQRRQHDVVTEAAQRRGGALVVGFGPRHQKAHGQASAKKSAPPRRSQFAAGGGADPFGVRRRCRCASSRMPRCRRASRIMPRNRRPPPKMVAWPAIGVRHEPSSTARNARSAASALAVVGVIDRRQQVSRPSVVAARLDGDGALPDRRQKVVDVEHRGRRVRQAEPLQSGQRQQRGVGRALVELAQARLDIAAQRHDPEIGTQPQRPAPAGATTRCRWSRRAAAPGWILPCG